MWTLSDEQELIVYLKSKARAVGEDKVLSDVRKLLDGEIKKETLSVNKYIDSMTMAKHHYYDLTPKEYACILWKDKSKKCVSCPLRVNKFCFARNPLYKQLMERVGR